MSSGNAGGFSLFYPSCAQRTTDASLLGINPLCARVDPRLFHNSRERGSAADITICSNCKFPLPTKEDEELVTRITSKLLGYYEPLKSGSNIQTAVLCGKPSPHCLWVARRVAEHLEEHERLLGSIFLPSAINENDSDAVLYRIILSITCQMTLTIPETRTFIDAAIINDPSIFDRATDRASA